LTCEYLAGPAIGAGLGFVMGFYSSRMGLKLMRLLES
jgi:hypothetical protein